MMHTYANLDAKVAGFILTIFFHQALANYFIPKLPTFPIRAVGDWCIQCNAPHTDYSLKTKYCFTGIQSALVNNGLLISSGINAKLKTQVPQIKVMVWPCDFTINRVRTADCN